MNPTLSHHRLRPQAATIRGFSLVELMVTMVIVAILAALALAGLSGVRQRAKIDKTRSTIRKLNEIILPQYESYLDRRVKVTGGQVRYLNAPAGAFVITGTKTEPGTVAYRRLRGLRLAMSLELPDQWADVAPATPPTPPSDVPEWAVTSPVRRYAAFKAAAAKANKLNPTTAYESAECLAMIVLRGGFNPNAVEAFRADEIGDIDNDGAPEFHDGWGRPIAFIRWPAGFMSPVQQPDATVNPDPFDPMLITVTGALGPDYGLIPLIYSPGPDEATNDPNTGGESGYGLQSSSAAVPLGWANLPGWATPTTTGTLSTRQGSPYAGAYSDGTGSAARDNVTNHDLLKK